MVKNLVELHGGNVKAYSAGDNKGSQFIVYLDEKFKINKNNEKIEDSISVILKGPSIDFLY